MTRLTFPHRIREISVLQAQILRRHFEISHDHFCPRISNFMFPYHSTIHFCTTYYVENVALRNKIIYQPLVSLSYLPASSLVSCLFSSFLLFTSLNLPLHNKITNQPNVILITPLPFFAHFFLLFLVILLS